MTASGIPISQLDSELPPITGEEVFPIVQSGQTRKIKLNKITNVSASQYGKTGGDTVANLVGITPVSDNVKYDAVSFYNNWIAVSTLPQGGGLFVWSATTPKSQHDGYRVISPTVRWSIMQSQKLPQMVRF